ncbi:hypothetical protein CPT_Slocum_173 [Serratia phage Slocum]|nr:hypothetical protein CPT_Slocum_173 [Serratia phage Slocum]URC22537.1 hypothetical protein KAMAJI_01090 [Serratia phage vB_SmaM-Kamaji]
MLCEAQGIEPDPELIPLEFSDFPEIVETAATIYNKLRDTYIPQEMPHYIGKDLTPLEMLYRMYDVEDPEEKRFILDVITIFDYYAVQSSGKRIEAEVKKLKNKPKK